jgi:hypothetical protein
MQAPISIPYVSSIAAYRQVWYVINITSFKNRKSVMSSSCQLHVHLSIEENGVFAAMTIRNGISDGIVSDRIVMMVL